MGHDPSTFPANFVPKFFVFVSNEKLKVANDSEGRQEHKHVLISILGV